MGDRDGGWVGGWFGGFSGDNKGRNGGGRGACRVTAARGKDDDAEDQGEEKRFWQKDLLPYDILDMSTVIYNTLASID